MLGLPSFAELNLFPLLPATIVAVGMCILLLVDLWIPDGQKTRTAWGAIGILIVAFIANLFTFNSSGEALGGMFVADRITAFLNVVSLITGILAVLLSIDYLKRAQIERGEFYSLLLFSVSGAMFMSSANDLVMIFVALELLSIPLYVMAAFRYPKRNDNDPQHVKMGLMSEESGMKYFLLGAFASAFLVYGSALVYGATGTTSLPAIFAALDAGVNVSYVLALFGGGLILVGLGFKIAVFPFHTWTPDVYEGAPTNVTAYMSVAAKVGGVAALARILATALPTLTIGTTESAAWQLSVSVVAALTMILGNLVALRQTNLKRMLAYSSIAHGGYMLTAIAAGSVLGTSQNVMVAVSIYLMTYAFTNLGAFAILIAIEKDNGTGSNIDDLTGLSKSRPGLAAMMLIFMLSLIGMPATAGFIGKYFVFAAAVDAGLYVLAIIGVLTSVASVYYYMRPVMRMYLMDDGEGDPAAGATPYVRWVAYIAVAGVLLIGIVPGLAVNLLTVVASAPTF
ncbi:MAG: NADH-quinone oxidoreductase subunit N [Phototrophicaceae bacterium]|jgi:NADH-quinone oxidoreductase subunit N